MKEKKPNTLRREPTETVVREENRESIERPRESIFRSSPWSTSAHDNDMWALKRANPVHSDGEEDEIEEAFASPTKRIRVAHVFDDDDEPIILFQATSLSDESIERE